MLFFQKGKCYIKDNSRGDSTEIGKVRKNIMKVWMFEGRYREYQVNEVFGKGRRSFLLMTSIMGPQFQGLFFGFLQFHLEKLQVIQQFHLQMLSFRNSGECVYSYVRRLHYSIASTNKNWEAN